MSILFTKMSGSGNDFIIIDNRESLVKNSEKRDLVSKICVPKVSVGVDGVIFVENSEKVDFKWDFYNGDGSSAEMCGNGGRCVARYAYEKSLYAIFLFNSYLSHSCFTNVAPFIRLVLTKEEAWYVILYVRSFGW